LAHAAGGGPSGVLSCQASFVPGGRKAKENPIPFHGKVIVTDYSLPAANNDDMPTTATFKAEDLDNSDGSFSLELGADPKTHFSVIVNLRSLDGNTADW